MTAELKSRETRARKIVQSSDIEERIRRRAYQLYEEPGRVDGFALDDWLQAKARFSERRNGRRKQREGLSAHGD